MSIVSALQKRCPRCGTANQPEAAFCHACSQSLAGIAPSSSSAALDVNDATMIQAPPTSPRRASGAASPSSPLPPSASVSSTSGPDLSTTGLLSEDSAVGQRYRIKRLIGKGGMGIVYLAHDVELDRDVALKVIRVDIAENLDALDRFKREVQLSSRITHKNVLRVYDFGEAGGLKYLTMEFVDGEDVSSLVKRDGRLPVPQVLSILRQTCAGLEAAHEQGVIHRDLKPQNVMIERGGRVLLTDFGLAKATAIAGVTQTGAILGTPFYMSPEQIKGETLDARSDIYSLGIVLYEMLTGEVPFSGGTAYEVMSRRLHQSPRPAIELNADIPVYLQRVLDRCLAVDAGRRYESCAAVLADLDAATYTPPKKAPAQAVRTWRRLALAALVVGAVFAAAGWGWRYVQHRRAEADRARTPVSVLVADFENRTGDSVFDGTLEPAFGVALEGAPFITSYNRGSAQEVAAELRPGTTKLNESLARLVAAREGVSVVTAGIVEKSGNGYHLSVRAIDAVTGNPVASADDEVASKDEVLSTVTKLAASVRRALGDSTPASTQMAAAETFSASSLEAAHAYAAAQDLGNKGKWDEAIARFKQAIALDQNLGRAYAGLAVSYYNLGRQTEAVDYYKQAMARIGRMSDREKYRTRGTYYLVTRQPDRAIAELAELVKSYPADSAGLANLAVAYYLKRDMARALEFGRRAAAIYPKDAPLRNNVGLFAMYAGDTVTAIEEQKTAIEMKPDFVAAHVGLALSQLVAGKPDDAIATWQKTASLGSSGASQAALGLADIALYNGRLADARATLEPAIDRDLAEKDAINAALKLTALAEAHLAAGDRPRAVAAADRARSTTLSDNVALHVGLVLAAAGEERRALGLASELETKLEPDPQLYSRLIRGELALRRQGGREAIQQFTEAQKLTDSWLGRYGLGRAFLVARAYTEAHSELEMCIRRKGEAAAVLIDEVPTYRFFPRAYFHLAQAYEGLNSPSATDTYRMLLGIKEKGDEPLVADLRKKLASR